MSIQKIKKVGKVVYTPLLKYDLKNKKDKNNNFNHEKNNKKSKEFGQYLDEIIKKK